jgi:hypothetical protein
MYFGGAMNSEQSDQGDQSANANDGKKQMKLFLNNSEHSVVTAAASMKGMSVADYMKAAVLEKAKEDARGLLAIIDTIKPGFKK